MFDLGRSEYPYLEEVNEGILRQFKSFQPQGKVLDVGCGRGQLGEAIQSLGWEVWGIERNDEANKIAEKRLARVICADIMDESVLASVLEKDFFSTLVFSDVLEHLYDPLKVLTKYLNYIPVGGRVLISVPNAVVWTNRFKWLLGRVEYEDTGVMDRTHIRFFTFKTARLLIEKTGCKIVKVDSTPYIVRAFLPVIKSIIGSKTTSARSIIESKPFQFYMRYFYPFENLFASFWKGMFAFRIILVAEKIKQL